MKASIDRELNTRVFSVWGTVLYVDPATGQLRHGPIDESPENVIFVVDRTLPGSKLRGWLVHDLGDSLQPITCAAHLCWSAAVSAEGEPAEGPTPLALVELERGLVGIEADGRFLGAQPDGSVILVTPRCSLWEFFLLSEDWRVHFAEARQGEGRRPHTTQVDYHYLRNFVISPVFRVRTMKNTEAAKFLIYGHTSWSHGRVYYDLTKHLYRKGFIVDILEWNRGYHSSEIEELKAFYDFFITSFDLGGISNLVGTYGVPYERILALSHADFIRDEAFLETYKRFANFGVVSDSLLASSMSLGIPRIPAIVPLGIDFANFYAEPSERLATVGYASSMKLEWMNTGIDRKRGELARQCAEEASLAFLPAGSIYAQISIHDMPGYYKAVDAVLMTSLFESAGLAVTEAAAAGRLVIGTPVGHFPLRAYAGGGIIAPLKATKFKEFTVEKLIYYKENPSEYVNICRSIQESARQFDWEYMIGDWVEFLEDAIASSASVR